MNAVLWPINDIFMHDALSSSLIKVIVHKVRHMLRGSCCFPLSFPDMYDATLLHNILSIALESFQKPLAYHEQAS